jgi:hypothetical protein
MQRMPRKVSARILAVTALFATGCLVALTAGVAPALAASDTITLTHLKFAEHSVDATSGTATVNLNWTIKDSDADATTVSGEVSVRLEGRQAGTYVGYAYVIPFSTPGNGTGGATGTGTAQDSSYTWAFPVPQYAWAAKAHWVVTKVTVQDDQHGKLRLSGGQLGTYAGTLTATELVDSTPPTYDSLQFPVSTGPSRPYVYDGGTAGGSSSYSFNADDSESGFWKGRITLTGPGGATLSASFRYTYSVPNFIGACGEGTVFDDTSAQCQIAVTVPQGTPAGTWTVSSLELWDNAGNHATYQDLDALPVTVTSNGVIQASGFAADPAQVDNWATTGTSQITMEIAGAQDGVSDVYVDFAAGSPCSEPSATPTQNADGSYSVTVDMFSIATSCTVAGIAVTDGAGNVSVYGAEYGEPDLGIELTQIPDTTPPVATGASVSPASQPESPNTGFEGLTIDVDDAVAPVTQVSTTVFNSSGQIVGGGSGGVTATLDGAVETDASLPADLPPGTYTVAFQITDAGGLTSSYGYPTSPPVPGGPLTFTVTPASGS